MTESEFGTFAKRLFTQFPSLYEWLSRSSPDPEGTQKLWRKTLSRYSLADCMGVLDFWAESGQAPFEAYQRDQVAVIVRSVIQRRVDAENRKREQREEARRRNERGRRNKSDGERLEVGFGGDLGCASAFNELKPVYAAWKDGKIDEAEYRERETEILERHIDEKPKREIAGRYCG